MRKLIDGSARARTPGSAAVEFLSRDSDSQALTVPVCNAEPGSRHAARELLYGMAESLSREANMAEEQEVAECLIWTIADLMDAADAII